MSAGIKYLGIPIHPIVDITYKTESEKNIIENIKEGEIVILY